MHANGVKESGYQLVVLIKVHLKIDVSNYRVKNLSMHHILFT